MTAPLRRVTGASRLRPASIGVARARRERYPTSAFASDFQCGAHVSVGAGKGWSKTVEWPRPSDRTALKALTSLITGSSFGGQLGMAVDVVSGLPKLQM